MAINPVYGTGTYKARLPAVRIPSVSTIGGVASPLDFYQSSTSVNVNKNKNKDGSDTSLLDFLVSDVSGAGTADVGTSQSGMSGTGLSGFGSPQGQAQAVASIGASLGGKAVSALLGITNPLAAIAVNQLAKSVFTPQIESLLGIENLSIVDPYSVTIDTVESFPIAMPESITAVDLSNISTTDGGFGGDSSAPGEGAAGSDNAGGDVGAAGDASIGGDWYAGGLVTQSRLFGTDPSGPDTGSGHLQHGEYVIQKSMVDKYGKVFFDLLNQGKV